MLTSPPQRTPPRFVPTLTEVVHLPVDAVSHGRGNHDGGVPMSVLAPAAVGLIEEQAPTDGRPSALEAQLVHQIMQRIDATLYDRLHEVVADVVRTHVQTLVPMLHEEVENAVRRTVVEAVTEEIRHYKG